MFFHQKTEDAVQNRILTILSCILGLVLHILCYFPGILELIFRILSHLPPILAHLGPILGQLGPILASVWASWGAPNLAKSLIFLRFFDDFEISSSSL